MADDLVDLDGSGDGYSGTFRWKKSKKLHSLPERSLEPISLEEGWIGYFLSRCCDENAAAGLIAKVQADMSMIDCLSSPVTIACICQRLKLSNLSKRIAIICIGCAEKAEERILRETNCWLETLDGFERLDCIDIWLVGPEVSITSEKVVELMEPGGSCFIGSTFRGTSLEFFRKYPRYLKDFTIVVGLNCGFGNFENPLPKRYDLFFNWLPDLYFLTGTQLPLIFTCASERGDLRGETEVLQKILGVNFILEPEQNAFGFASTLVPPITIAASSVSGQARRSDTDEHYRGNSYIYATQGFDKSRRRKLDWKSSDRISALLQLLRSSPLLPYSRLLVPYCPPATAARPVAAAVAQSPQPTSAISAVAPSSNATRAAHTVAAGSGVTNSTASDPSTSSGKSAGAAATAATAAAAPAAAPAAATPAIPAIPTPAVAPSRSEEPAGNKRAPPVDHTSSRTPPAEAAAARAAAHMQTQVTATILSPTDTESVSSVSCPVPASSSSPRYSSPEASISALLPATSTTIPTTSPTTTSNTTSATSGLQDSDEPRARQDSEQSVRRKIFASASSVEQALSIEADSTLVISFPLEATGASSLSQVALFVDSSGRTLRVTAAPPAAAGEESAPAAAATATATATREFPASAPGAMEISLLQRVQPDTLSARFSKKTKRVTVSAILAAQGTS